MRLGFGRAALDIMQPSKTSSPSSQPAAARLAALVILVALVIVAFSPVLVAGYLRLDDYDNVVRNPNVAGGGLGAPGLAAIWGESRLGFYIPITYSIWWLCAGLANRLGSLAQGAPLLHALNLIVHAVNAAVVFFLVKRLLDLLRPGLSPLRHPRLVALVAALFFALHPAQVETVAWVTELKGLAAALFGLLGISSYYRRGEQNQASKMGVTALLFVLAMLSKPSAIVFPGLLVLVDRIILGKPLKESCKGPLFFWALLAPLVLVTKHLQPDANLEYVPGLGGRFLVAADSFAFYCRRLLSPWHLALDYGRAPYRVLHQVPGWHLTLSAALLVAGAGLVGYALLRRPGAGRGPVAWSSLVLCGWSIYCLALLPVLGLVPFAFQDFTTVADHYLYLPLFGGGLVVAGVLLRLAASLPALWVSAATIIALAASSFAQARYWRSTETLFAHTLAINPESYLAHYAIATELLDAGRIDDGIRSLQACLRLRPGYLSAQVAIGAVWVEQGKLQEAIEHYQAFLGTNPSIVGKRAAFMAMIHDNLGTALCNVGREREGAEQFEKALALDPTSVTAHVNLGRFALGEGRFLDAAVHYQAALELSPDDAEIRRMLSLARSQGRGR